MKRFLAYCTGLLAATTACLGLLDLQEVGYGERPEAGAEAGADGAASCSGPNETQCGGSCVDLKTDPKNCGRCGRDCTTCNEGRCEAEVVAELTEAIDGYKESTYGVETDDNYIYFSTWPIGCPAGVAGASCESLGRVLYKPKSNLGAAPKVLSARQGQPGDLQRIGDQVHWGSWAVVEPDAGSASVRGASVNAQGVIIGPRDYCKPSEAGVCDYNYSLTSDGQRLFVSEYQRGIHAYDLDGGSVFGIRHLPEAGLPQTDLRGVAVDSERVYWTTKRSERSLPKSRFFAGSYPPSEQTELVTFGDGAELDAIQVEGDFVYFANRKGGGAGSLHRVPKGGGSAETLAERLGNTRQILVEPGGDPIYVVSLGGNKLWRVNRNGTSWSAEVIKDSLNEPLDVVSDANYLYFTGGLDGKVWRIRK